MRGEFQERGPFKPPPPVEYADAKERMIVDRRIDGEESPVVCVRRSRRTGSRSPLVARRLMCDK